jgi:hypothetical protein
MKKKQQLFVTTGSRFEPQARIDFFVHIRSLVFAVVSPLADIHN